MKEERARLERERLEKAKEADAWSGLDLLAQGNSKSTSSTNIASNDDWLFDKPTLPSSSSYPTPPDDDLLFSTAADAEPSALRSRSQSQAHTPKASTTSSTSLFDILSEDFSPAALPSNSNIANNGTLSSYTLAKDRERSSPAVPSRSNSPGDFDFGDREDRLLNDSGSEGEGGEDILGILAEPADSIPKRRISVR